MITERLFNHDLLTLDYYNSNKYIATLNEKYTLPQCTTYANGRVQEIAQACFKDELPNNNKAAKYYGPKLGLNWPVQERPVEGGILVFSNDATGHVGVCERFIEEKDGKYHILMSDSGANKQKNDYYYLRDCWLKVGEKPSDWGDYTYVHCCVNPHAVDKRVPQNAAKNQLEVYKDRLRVRTGPGSEYPNHGQFAPVGWYDIIEMKKNGNDIWCKLDENQWCMVANGYSRLHEATIEEPVPEPDSDELWKQVKELEENNKKLQKESLAKDNKINDLSAQVKELDNKANNLQSKIDKAIADLK